MFLYAMLVFVSSCKISYAVLHSTTNYLQLFINVMKPLFFFGF